LIAEGIKLNSALSEIFLFSNDIGAEGAKWIGEALKQNSALEGI
jgi:hypothetical protein